jgi:importin subunit alpha-1
MSLRPNSKADARKQRYKVAVDTEEAHRKREENMVEIRKSKREESLLKKRREAVASAPDSQSSTGYDQTISLDEKVSSHIVTWYITI